MESVVNNHIYQQIQKRNGLIMFRKSLEKIKGIVTNIRKGYKGNDRKKIYHAQKSIKSATTSSNSQAKASSTGTSSDPQTKMFSANPQIEEANTDTSSSQDVELSIRKILAVELSKILKHPLLIAMLPLVIGVLGKTVIQTNKLLTQMETVNKGIADLNTKTDSMNSSINGRIDGLQISMAEQIGEINRDIGVLEGKVGTSIVINPNDAFKDLLNGSYYSDQNVFDTSKKKERLFNNTDIEIATDISGKLAYTAKDLENQVIILTYTNIDGEEVFFKGQYDENGLWDGNCIINRYKDNVLTMIMDAEYNSGNLISYKQVFSYVSSNEEGEPVEIWAVSEREVDGNANSGETWMYFKDEEYEKRININSIEENDIKSKDVFCSDMDLQIAGYYSGYTSNGMFNDDTGEAYMIKYTKGGYVSLLYFGRFVNGQPEDSTGEAWFIGLGYWGYDYFYYNGAMQDGTRVNTPNNWTALTKEEIRELIDNRDVKCELKWLWDGKVITI